MDFSDLASRYMDARLGPVTQMFTNPGQAMTDRISNDLGVDVTGANVKPKSTTVNYNEDGTQDVTHKFNVGAPPAAAPSASTAGQGLGPDFAQYQAPPSAGAGRGFVNPPAQPTPQQIPQTTAPAPQQTAQGQQQTAAAPQAVPPSMSGMPQSPGAGMFPQGAQPIASGNQPQPMDNLSAIQQIESGGNNAAVGAAGETGAMQVMPTSLKNPGYGVKSARDNTPEEANRVGRDYYTAMLNRYQDPVLAAAAYNAGPGTMDRAIARSSQEGGHPMAYMPNSTQEYAAKFAQLTGHAPGKRAEDSDAKNPWKLTNTGMTMPGDKVSEQHDDLNAARGNPQKLTALATSDEATPAVKAHAADELTNHFEDIKKTNTAAKTVDAGLTGADPASSQKVATALNPNSRPSEEGSYIKAYLFHRFGLEDLARQEQEKISPTSTYQSLMDQDGNHYSAKIGKDGQILSAKDANGADVNANTIAKLQANAAQGVKGAESLGYADIGGEQHVISRGLDKNGNMVWRDETAKKQLSGAPVGYQTTPTTPQQRAQFNIASQIEKRMRADNSDAARTNSTLPHTEEDIANEKARILSGLAPTYTPAKATTATTAPTTAGTAATPAGAVAPAAEVEGPWSTPEANATAKRNPTAEAIASYRAAPPSATGRNSAGSAALMNDVRKINPDFNEQKFKEAQIVRNDFASVKPGSGGGQLQAVRRAIPHLDQFRTAVDELNNGHMPAVNGILNQYGYNVGDDKVAAAKALSGLISTEVQKAVAGGLGGVGEREELAKSLSPNMNPQQLKKVVQGWQGLIATQSDALKQQWTGHGLPEKEFNGLLGKRELEVINAARKRNENTRGNW